MTIPRYRDMKSILKYGKLLLILAMVSCSNESKKEEAIEAIPISIELIRFDQEFAKAKPEDLTRIKQKFPQFFPEQYNDSIWLFRMTDTLQQELNEEVLKVFPINNDIEEQLLPLFQHIKYYFTDFKTPKVYTTTSDVDYRTKVIANDSLLILELDTYLGSDHPFYEGLPLYVSKNLKESQLVSDVATVYARHYVMPPRQRNFLSYMVYYGKILYLKDLWMPNASDAEKIGYLEDDIKWAKENEVEIWRYMIENELLYDSNPKLGQRFLDPAPFSKFNLEIDNESPGMIGRWLGWQMVRSYMEKNEVSVKQLMLKSADELFNESKYKPSK